MVVKINVFNVLSFAFHLSTLLKFETVKKERRMLLVKKRSKNVHFKKYAFVHLTYFVFMYKISTIHTVLTYCICSQMGCDELHHTLPFIWCIVAYYTVWDKYSIISINDYNNTARSQHDWKLGYLYSAISWSSQSREWS